MDPKHRVALNEVQTAKQIASNLRTTAAVKIEEMEQELRDFRQSASERERAILRHAVKRAIEAGVPKSMIAEEGLQMSRTVVYKLMADENKE